MEGENRTKQKQTKINGKEVQKCTQSKLDAFFLKKKNKHKIERRPFPSNAVYGINCNIRSSVVYSVAAAA